DGGGGGDNGGASEASQRPSIEEEPGNLEVFEWAGYEFPTYGGKKGALAPYVKKYGKPKYTFLTSDDQALGKVRAGYRPDLAHPCVDYLQQWVEMGTVEPWDPSLLKNFKDLEEPLVKGGQLDGKQYFLPADWGFSSPLYRADKVEPKGEESWTLFYDERYKGKISWWDTPLENFVIWGYVNGVDDPWNMSEEELDEAKDFLISKKHLCRNFWSSQTDLDNDFAAGNVWIAYAWAGSYTAAKKAGLDVVYSDPKEGRLAWNCGFVLMKDSKNYRHAHAYVDDWSSTESADWIIANYAYGHANTKVDLSKVDPDLVKVFRLDNPEGRQEPNAHYARPVPTPVRAAYAERWDEVKAA
ncbi:MAG: extracellular solute-binding protein, partial [Actinomycetota bacterium]|nr:extracellular solute-binding protein [Actinomycetota bacterium]